MYLHILYPIFLYIYIFYIVLPNFSNILAIKSILHVKQILVVMMCFSDSQIICLFVFSTVTPSNEAMRVTGSSLRHLRPTKDRFSLLRLCYFSRS